MANLNHGALLFLAADFADGLTGLSRLVYRISDLGRITGISSIYKRYHDYSSENFNSDLVLSIRLETSLSSYELHRSLEGISTGLILLAWDQEVNMHPGRNLPHTDLHSDSLTLRCAAEAWGSYEHPVLGQTLNEIVKSDHRFEKVEFFAQGQTVLDAHLGDHL